MVARTAGLPQCATSNLLTSTVSASSRPRSRSVSLHCTGAVNTSENIRASDISARYDEKYLWRTDPQAFYAARCALMHVDNDKTREYSVVPDGVEKNLCQGSTPDVIRYTQPTMKSCNLSSLFSACQGLPLLPLLSRDTILEKFEYFTSHVLTSDEKRRLFLSGLNLVELTAIANRFFEQEGSEWRAKSYCSSVSMKDELSNLIKDNEDFRLIVNFGSSILYQQPGNGGHFAHVDKVRLRNDTMYLHLIEHARYKYPDSPWIPFDHMLEAMSAPGSDGQARGYIVLRK